jgi:hypothetical protein
MYVHVRVHYRMSSIKIRPYEVENKLMEFDNVHYYNMIAFVLAEGV